MAILPILQGLLLVPIRHPRMKMPRPQSQVSQLLRHPLASISTSAVDYPSFSWMCLRNVLRDGFGQAPTGFLANMIVQVGTVKGLGKEDVVLMKLKTIDDVLPDFWGRGSGQRHDRSIGEVVAKCAKVLILKIVDAEKIMNKGGARARMRIWRD